MLLGLLPMPGIRYDEPAVILQKFVRSYVPDHLIWMEVEKQRRP
jgi:hypothetical protein